MIKNWVGFYTLSSREIMRFFSVWRQTIIPGIVTTLLYIFVFGVALENRISEIGGVSYKIYILPGLLMMKKLLQTLPELLITPLSSLELSLSFIIGGAIRGFVNGILILLICSLAGMPILIQVWVFLLDSYPIPGISLHSYKILSSHRLVS